jgi:hypothetical protein
MEASPIDDREPRVRGSDVSITHRFGKRIPLPSRRQIRHELILMWAADELREIEVRAAPQATISPQEIPGASAQVVRGV